MYRWGRGNRSLRSLDSVGLLNNSQDSYQFLFTVFVYATQKIQAKNSKTLYFTPSQIRV